MKRLRPPYNDYSATKCGKVYSHKRGLPKELKPHTVYGGGFHGKRSTPYKRVSLYSDGARVHRLLHVIICEVFHGRPHAQGLVVCHNDGDSTNCASDNLRWDTPEANMEDRKRHKEQKNELL